MIVGIDIGGHHVAGALVDNSNWTFDPATYRHVEVERTAGRDQLLDAWAAVIDDIASSASDPIGGVGIAMPGPFDYASGVGYFEGTGKFESLYGVDVGRELNRRCSVAPEVRFLNDATAFAVGCTADIAMLRTNRILAMTLGTGLGSAFLERGMPTISDAEGTVPPHGSLWHLPFKDGIADDYVSSRWLLRRAQQVLGPAIKSVAKIADTVRTTGRGGDIFDEYGANLAQIIAPWVKSFSSEALVLGGRICGAFDLFSGSLEAGLASAGALRPIVVHESTEDAAILGAATCFNDEFWTVARTRLPAR